MVESMVLISSIHSAVNNLIEKKDMTLAVAIDLDNPSYAWTCLKENTSGNKRCKWVSSKTLIINRIINMVKISELSFKCYEASILQVKVTIQPSVHDMIVALCRCSNCMINIKLRHQLVK